MQKKIIALAIAGLSGASFAQSNVTVSGQLKASMEFTGMGGCTSYGTAGCNNNATRTRITDNTTYVRFSGVESLGNGMSAVFQIESDAKIDDATASASGANGGGMFATRNSYVGLTGNWGTAIMGRHDVHYTDLAPVDGWWAGAGPLATSSLSLFNLLPSGLTNATGTAPGAAAGIMNAAVFNRLNNVAAYISPTWSGLSFKLGFTAGPTSNENTTAGLSSKDYGWTFVPKYINGPIAAVWAHTEGKNLTLTSATSATVTVAAGAVGTIATALTGAGLIAPAAGGLGGGAAAASALGNRGANVKADRLGASYTFPMGLKVGLIYDNTKATDAATGVSWGKRTGWALPISYQTGAHGFYFDYAKVGESTMNDGAGNNVNLSGSGARFYSLGYQYDLSKRTAVTVSYSRINNDSNGIYDFFGRGAGVQSPGQDPSTTQFGIRHSF